MGSSFAISSKFQTQGGDQDYRWGTCEMQGWRDDMEDRLIVRVPLINDLSMFCICDGHGGQGASSFLEERLVEEMLDLDRPLDATDLIKMFQRLDAQFLDGPWTEAKISGSTCVLALVVPVRSEQQKKRLRHYPTQLPPAPQDRTRSYCCAKKQDTIPHVNEHRHQRVAQEIAEEDTKTTKPSHMALEVSHELDGLYRDSVSAKQQEETPEPEDPSPNPTRRQAEPPSEVDRAPGIIDASVDDKEHSSKVIKSSANPSPRTSLQSNGSGIEPDGPFPDADTNGTVVTNTVAITVRSTSRSETTVRSESMASRLVSLAVADHITAASSSKPDKSPSVTPTNDTTGFPSANGSDKSENESDMSKLKIRKSARNNLKREPPSNKHSPLADALSDVPPHLSPKLSPKHSPLQHKLRNLKSNFTPVPSPKISPVQLPRSISQSPDQAKRPSLTQSSSSPSLLELAHEEEVEKGRPAAPRRSISMDFSSARLFLHQAKQASDGAKARDKDKEGTNTNSELSNSSPQLIPPTRTSPKISPSNSGSGSRSLSQSARGLKLDSSGNHLREVDDGSQSLPRLPDIYQVGDARVTPKSIVSRLLDGQRHVKLHLPSPKTDRVDVLSYRDKDGHQKELPALNQETPSESLNNSRSGGSSRRVERETNGAELDRPVSIPHPVDRPVAIPHPVDKPLSNPYPVPVPVAEESSYSSLPEPLPTSRESFPGLEEGNSPNRGDNQSRLRGLPEVVAGLAGRVLPALSTGEAMQEIETTLPQNQRQASVSDFPDIPVETLPAATTSNGDSNSSMNTKNSNNPNKLHSFVISFSRPKNIEPNEVLNILRYRMLTTGVVPAAEDIANLEFVERVTPQSTPSHAALQSLTGGENHSDTSSQASEDTTTERTFVRVTLANEQALEHMRNNQHRIAAPVTRNQGVLPESKPLEKPSHYLLTIVNVGDSRALLIHADGTFTALTQDHDPNAPKEKERIEAAGGKVMYGRVDGGLAMSRAFGDGLYKRPGLPQRVVCEPDVTRVLGKPGDLLFVACDGLFERMTWAAVAAFVRREYSLTRDPALVCKNISDFSLRAGSMDNMSCICVELGDGSDYPNKIDFHWGPIKTQAEPWLSNYMNNARMYGQDELPEGMSLPEERWCSIM